MNLSSICECLGIRNFNNRLRMTIVSKIDCLIDSQMHPRSHLKTLTLY